jgi:ribosomal protein S18 acetylase RimI-like enzyme
MGIEIVPYAERHFEGIDALWREAFPDAEPRNSAERVILVKLTVQPDLILIATEGDLVVGSVLAGFDGYRGWLSKVAVLKSHRRRGLGTQLIAEAESRLKALGCTKINLQVIGSNADVVPFYESLGYLVEDRISMGKRADRDRK